MHLPEDLVMGILSRVSVACLARLRSVSKGWKALIRDERLAEKQSQVMMMLIDFRVYLVTIDFHETHNNKVKVSRQFSLKDPLSTNSSEEVDIRHILHYNGLLLCTTEDNRLVVWNPCSRETRWIQHRDTYKRQDYFSLGRSSCNNYKILRMDQYGPLLNPSYVKFEIYDFTSNTWRVVGETRDWYILRRKCRVMSVNGNSYWLAFSEVDQKGDFLQSFDFSAERFGRVSLPDDTHFDNVMSLSVTREDQQLCLLATRGLEIIAIDVWIATKIESNGAASWTKSLYVSLANLHRPFIFCNAMNYLVDRVNKVIVCRGKHGVSDRFLHVVGKDKCIQVDHNDAKSRCSLVVSYVPSFVQII